jgi:hypothetical protein
MGTADAPRKATYQVQDIVPLSSIVFQESHGSLPRRLRSKNRRTKNRICTDSYTLNPQEPEPHRLRHAPSPALCAATPSAAVCAAGGGALHGRHLASGGGTEENVVLAGARGHRHRVGGKGPLAGRVQWHRRGGVGQVAGTGSSGESAASAARSGLTATRRGSRPTMRLMM